MTQIEDIAKLVFKDGMTEQDFFNALYVELGLRDAMLVSGLNREQQKAEKTSSGISYYDWLIKAKADAGYILGHLYHIKKYFTFPPYSESEKKQMKTAMKNTSEVLTIEQGGFYFRELKGRQLHGALERFQVSADMNPEIIKTLDSFIKKYKCNYKTTSPEDWNKRTDTVNVYMYEPITDKIKEEFVQIISPYIRKNSPSPDGEKLAKGIGIASELHHGDPRLNSIIDQYPSHMKQAANDFFLSSVSLGKVATAKEFLDMYKKYAPRLQGKTLTPKTNTTKPPVAPTPKIATPQSQQPIDELTPQYFKDKNGISGIRYLDKTGNVVITETYQANCTKRVYSNGLTMHMWKNPKSTTYTDGSKTGKDVTEVMVTELGKGCTKDVVTTGELKRKIEEVRKAGLLLTELPKDKKQSSLLGRLARHSVDNAVKVSSRTGGKISNT